VQKQQKGNISDGSAGTLFVCPFSKYDPWRYSQHNTAGMNYRGCSSCFLKDISRVKQHLYRVHKRPDHYCEGCFEDFETQEMLDNHTRQRPACEVAEARFPEKMSRDQLYSIKRRRPARDSCETWFIILHDLVPFGNNA